MGIVEAHKSRPIWSEATHKFVPYGSTITQNNNPSHELPSILDLFLADTVPLISCKTYAVHILKRFFGIYLDKLPNIAPY